jgi:hypothetical protein
MSNYADLKFAGYPVCEMRNVANRAVMVLFTKEERSVGTNVVDNEEHSVFVYQSTVESFIQRLEILGYTSNKIRKSFEAGIKKIDEKMKLTKSEHEIFSKFNFEIWKECMRLIIIHKLYESNIDKRLSELNIPMHLHSYINFILGNFIFDESKDMPEYYFSGSFEYGFSCYSDEFSGKSDSPCAEFYDILRAFLEVCDPSESVAFDYSSLVDWGTYDEEEDITEEPSKIIILTEGSTDREFLERTLKVLYPQLSKYYFFLEFHSSNLRGGSSSLVNLIKGFIGAGIFNKMIAVFDNDTAAIDALRSLSGVSLPDTIRIITLPHLNLAKDYPTIGPQGNINVDVNGLACSIEIYFGIDILTNTKGELMPIQWMGYNKVLEQYNGEILNKREIQEKYRTLLDKVETGQIETNKCDWSGMIEIIKTIFSAFTVPIEKNKW